MLPGHIGLAKRFVEEDELPRAGRSQECRYDAATPSIFRCVPFRRNKLLFFRENPSRCRARLTAAKLVLIPVRRTSRFINSATVASGVTATSSRSSSATFPRMGDSRPPLRGRGPTEPVSRCSRRTRLTVASPMSRNSAISAYVKPCSLKARTMVCRILSGRGRPTLMPASDQTLAITSTGPWVSVEVKNLYWFRDNPNRLRMAMELLGFLRSITGDLFSGSHLVGRGIRRMYP